MKLKEISSSAHSYAYYLIINNRCVCMYVYMYVCNAGYKYGSTCYMKTLNNSCDFKFSQSCDEDAPSEIRRRVFGNLLPTIRRSEVPANTTVTTCI
jgi:hypothetical protein